MAPGSPPNTSSDACALPRWPAPSSSGCACRWFGSNSATRPDHRMHPTPNGTTPSDAETLLPLSRSRERGGGEGARHRTILDSSRATSALIEKTRSCTHPHPNPLPLAGEGAKTPMHSFKVVPLDSASYPHATDSGRPTLKLPFPRRRESSGERDKFGFPLSR